MGSVGFSFFFFFCQVKTQYKLHTVHKHTHIRMHMRSSPSYSSPHSGRKLSRYPQGLWKKEQAHKVGWVVVVEGVGGGGCDEIGETSLFIVNSRTKATPQSFPPRCKRSHSWASGDQRQVYRTAGLDRLIPHLSGDERAHSWWPEDVGSEDVCSAGAELDMSRWVSHPILCRRIFILYIRLTRHLFKV